MKNNIVALLLMILVGVVAGMGLLFGISNAVRFTTAPIVDQLNGMAMEEKAIHKQLVQLTAKLTDLDDRFTRLTANAGRGGQGQQPPQEDLNKVYTIPVGNSMVIGKKDAPITIQEFTDLQCPFCARFYPAVKETLGAYPDKVNLLIKNYPLSFHPNARPAAKMALAANEQGKYREMMEMLLENGGDVTEPKVKEYAQKIGLNYDKLMADLKANEAKYEKQIVDDIALGGQVDVRGTPTFFINGKKTNARDAAGFKAEIDKILAAK